MSASTPDRAATQARPSGQARTEYGVLRHVLLCRPVHFRWLPTSAISKKTLESDAVFDSDRAQAQHLELTDALEGAGVTCHYLEPDAALPYQVFTRDSSVMTPFGPVIAQLAQEWRTGEHFPASNFYRQQGIEIWRTVTAGRVEGGDVMMVDEERALVGAGEARTTYRGASQLAGWLRDEGIEARVESFPARYVHLDVLCCILTAGLAAVCDQLLSSGLVRWLRSAGFEILRVSEESAMTLGVNVLSLGRDRILSNRGATELNEQMRAHGLTVLDPEISVFTMGGGGAHCLAQALDRADV